LPLPTVCNQGEMDLNSSTSSGYYSTFTSSALTKYKIIYTTVNINDFACDSSRPLSKYAIKRYIFNHLYQSKTILKH
jgi:hypothetical protein